MMLCFLKSFFQYINLCHLCSHLKKPWITDPSCLYHPLCTAITPSALPCSCHRSSQLTPFRCALPVVLYSCHVIVEVEPCSFRPEILFRAVLLHHLVSSWYACQSLASVTDGFPDALCWIIFNPVTDSFSDICHTSSNSAVPCLIISGPCHRTTS